MTNDEELKTNHWRGLIVMGLGQSFVVSHWSFVIRYPFYPRLRSIRRHFEPWARYE